MRSGVIDFQNSRSLLVIGATFVGIWAFFPNMIRSLTGRMFSSASATGVRICYITVPNKEVADNLSQSLVEGKLAACVNILPGIQSKYLWKGKIETDNELLLIVKTRDTLTDQLAQHLKKHHPYETPELICTDVVSGLPAYLQWVQDSTKSP